MQSVNLIVANHSALCDSILAVIALTLCSTDLIINSFVLFISNVVQNVNVIAALHVALCGRILRVIALTLIKAFVHCCFS